MPACHICGYSSHELSISIGVCVNCLRRGPDYALSYIIKNRSNWRSRIGLPREPPKEGTVKCIFCINECMIPEDGVGYCGVVKNKDGKLTYVTGSFEKAVLHWYLDPHPTNCVAGPVCPANTSAGYPRYTSSRGIERGFYNMAVFFGGCNLDCIFCQNIEHKHMISNYVKDSSTAYGDEYKLEKMYRDGLDPRITCICYFGGDPTPHIIYAIKLSEKFADASKEENILKRICWETNGLENPSLVRRMARLSLETGGIFKIDWKAYHPRVYQALAGVDGDKAVARIKENIRLICDIGRERKEVPLLVVSTLVVPHYIDEYEVEGIAGYLAEIDEEIPYVLLAFAPQHLMRDMPTTSQSQMDSVYKAAIDAGLKNVYVGNIWLLR